MRPTDKTRNQDLPRGQGDHSTLYVSLELSRSTWLVTSLSPNNDKMSKHTIAVGDASKLLALLTRLRGRAEQLVGGSSRQSLGRSLLCELYLFFWVIDSSNCKSAFAAAIIRVDRELVGVDLDIDAKIHTTTARAAERGAGRKVSRIP